MISQLVRLGYRVLVPFGFDHRYDLVLDVDDRFLRVQCKTGRLRRGRIVFNAQSIRSNARTSLRRGYADDVDLFAIYCADTDLVYAVPVEQATASVGSLRVDPPANGQVKGIRWASDFVLPAIASPA